jgi:histidinol-phosphatase
VTADLAFALELADLADSLSLPRFQARDLVIERKTDGTPVTDADRAVERALREAIRTARPAEAVLGEEDGGGEDAVRWIVDPIDGTRNFVRGVPVWGTLIALERQGEFCCGVVSAPAFGQRWWAATGQGAFRNGSPIRVSSVARLADAAVSAAYGRDLAALEPAVSHARAFGDFWQHMLVAQGSLDAAVDARLAVWDYPALTVIVAEAGGHTSALDGRPPRPQAQLVTSNGLVHGEVIALLE